MSDTELEGALVEALADWLTSPGVSVPPPRLERLYGAYRGRFEGHGPRCTCEGCFADVEELWGELGGLVVPDGP